MLQVQQCTTYCTGSCRTTQQASGRQYRHRSGTESWCLGGFWRAAKSRGLPWLRDGDWRADWQREGAGISVLPVLAVACEPVTNPGPLCSSNHQRHHLRPAPREELRHLSILRTFPFPYHHSIHLHPLLHHHQPLSFSIVNNNQPGFILYPSAFIHLSLT